MFNLEQIRKEIEKEGFYTFILEEDYSVIEIRYDEEDKVFFATMYKDSFDGPVYGTEKEITFSPSLECVLDKVKGIKCYE